MSIIDPVRTRVDLATLNLGFGVFPNVQPFSPRTATGYQDLLESLYRYVTRDIYRYLTLDSGQANWDANIDKLLAAVDTALAQQKSDIDADTAAALQAVIDSTIAVTDPVTYAIISDPSTATSEKLALLFAPLTEAGYVPNIPNGYVQNTRTARNAITGWWHVDDFGAVGDGVTHDEPAIQAAIDAATAAYTSTGAIQRVFFGSKTYLVGPAVAVNPVHAVMLKDGVELYGQGTVKVAPGSYWVGTDYAMLRSPTTGLTDAAITDLTFDGNRAAFSVPGDTTQCNNITLRTCTNVVFTKVKSIHAAGSGIMVAGYNFTASHDVRIDGCIVYDTGNIGIQVAQFDGLAIERNLVHHTASNAIDIYGENNGSGVSNGVNFRIENNTIHDSPVGIFLETVARGLVAGNHLRQLSERGMHINRINGQPEKINIVGNFISNCVDAIGATGDAQSITIRGNQLENFNHAGVLFGGDGDTPGIAGNIAGYFILDNVMNGNTDMTPLVYFGSGLGHIINVLHLRTVTNSKHREFDTINAGPGPVNSTWAPATAPGDV